MKIAGKVVDGKVVIDDGKLKEGSSVVVIAKCHEPEVILSPEQKSEREFHAEEYKQLKGEIAGILARIDTLARYAIIVPASVFAWLAVQGLGIHEIAGQAESAWCLKLPRELYRLAWYIPAAFVLLSGLAALVSIIRVGQMGGYLQKLETALGHRSLGWENALQGWPMITVLGVIFWVAVQFSTLYAAHIALTIVPDNIHACPAEMNPREGPPNPYEAPGRQGVNPAQE